ncbi:hypothetical protein WICMUC_005219 [Wickerhamomyces mucosus]|uniref:Cwf19-like C-terminal domain-containing protein n=1 Tax=Wickerhamomyces mucosus TaxID=1378264 RepID=A0A9P8T6V3_9ASCO|nr:hypothetical protein WICMUC_005219 [Wickerhamomyces mucosus]
MSQRDKSPKREGNREYRERPVSRRSRVSQTELNELNAKVLKARIKNAPNLNELENKYSELQKNFYQDREDSGEFKLSSGLSQQKHHFRANEVTEKEMTIDDMVKEERVITGVERSAFDSIIKDKKYSNDLDYQDENSMKLAKYAQKGSIDLRDSKASEARRMVERLDKCQLCIENEKTCDLLSMGEHVFLTVPPKSELVKYSAMIVPITHHKNTLHCDESEWEEIRNYMISLSKFYYTKMKKAVVFYENATNKYGHATINAVPIPLSEASNLKGFFRRAFLDEISDFAYEHSAIVDTQRNSETMGRDSFRYSIAKEAPYFHVWFTLNGGLGHIVQDVKSWPKGDLFARGILGGLLGIDPYLIKRQFNGWEKEDSRILEMSEIFKEFDWAENHYI